MTKPIDLAITYTELRIAAAKVVADWHAHNRISPRKRVQWASLSALEQVVNADADIVVKESR